MKKKCSKCARVRRLKFFGVDSRYRMGVKSWCKDCFHNYNITPQRRAERRKRYKAWRRIPANRESERKRGKRRWKGVEGKRALKNQIYKRKFGITIEEFDLIVKKQRGRCRLCKRKRRLCADHKPGTKRLRGAICWPCNTLLGHVEATPGLLIKMFKYVTRRG